MKHMKLTRILTACLASALLLASCASPAASDGSPDGGQNPGSTDEQTAFIPLAAAAKEPEGAEADARISDALTAFSEKFYKEAAKNAAGCRAARKNHFVFRNMNILAA